MAAEAVREPRNLYAPHGLTDEMIETVASNVNAQGWARFTAELSEALQQSQQENDLRPLNELVEAWYRTFIFMARPEFRAAWKDESAAEEQPLALDDIQRRRRQRTFA